MHKLKPISVPWTVHAGILSIVGYLAYRNWDSPKWDRRAVTAASVGLLALWGREMYVSIMNYLVVALADLRLYRLRPVMALGSTSVRNDEVASDQFSYLGDCYKHFV
jgi:hypothetical protein